VSKDAVFCFYCYLFRQEEDHEKYGHVVFTKIGFNDFKKAYRGFLGHVGGVSSCHNKARLWAEDFKNQRASITHNIDANTKTTEMLYEVDVESVRITNKLSLLFQRKDQIIVEAMSLLVDVKARLISLRNEGWEQLLGEVKSFCVAKEISIPNIEGSIPRWGRSRLDGNLITQAHHYCVDTFLVALDAIIMETDYRFNEVSSKLLVVFACLDPIENFARFDVEKIAWLTEIYDQDFSIADCDNIRDELETFLAHVRRVDDFKSCHDLGSLATTMIATKKHFLFPLVYCIIELAMILPMATSSVE
jgi:hypothetical protein